MTVSFGPDGPLTLAEALVRDNADISEIPSPAADSPGSQADAVLLLTPAQAAARLQVRESWLRAKVSARVVPCTFVGRHLRFSEAPVEAARQAIDGLLNIAQAAQEWGV
ncbi:helix-turn-helix domain-containing protein, partial [Streptodolium elevatio]